MPTSGTNDEPRVRSQAARLLVGGCALLAGGLGVAALAGWYFRVPFLTTLATGGTAMAPSAALLLALYGTSIGLRAWRPGRGVFWLGLVVHIAGAIVVLILGVSALGGHYTDLEHLGISIPQRMPETPPLGHMSPLAALCFFLGSASYLLSLFVTPMRPSRANTAGYLSGLLLLIGLALVLAYLFGVPLLYGTAVIPPALPTSLAFVALGLALLVLVWPSAWPSFREAELPQRNTKILAGVFVLIAVCILTAGFIIYRAAAANYRTQVARELSSIGNLKEAQLAKWRSERVGDAGIISENATFLKLAQRYLDNPLDHEAGHQIGDWLARYPGSYDYDQVRLLDAQGVTLLSFPPDRPALSAAVLKHVPAAVRAKNATIVDFYRHDVDHRIYLSILIPILDRHYGNRVIGVVSLRIDPEKYLYPEVLRWPTPTETGEILLVRREGDAILFLNGLKFKPNAALAERIALSQTELPPVMAALGKTGIVEGRDYRQEPVMADVRAVPNTPWFLVVRMNLSEVYAPMKLNLWTLAGFVVALLGISGAGLAALWRKQSAEFYQKQAAAAKALQKAHDLLNDVQRLSKLGGWDYDVSTSRAVWTDEVYRIHGISGDNPIEISKAIDFYVPEDRDTIRAAFERAMKLGEPYDLELRFVRANGERIWVRTIGKPVWENGKVVRISGNIMDITERKRIESELVAARRAAEDATALKAQFIDTAAHELRNPVTAFTVRLQLAQTKVEKGQPLNPAILDSLREPAERLSQLVADLLDVSRLERGLVAIRRTRIDIVPLLSQWVEEFQLLAPKRRISFSMPERKIELDLDPLRIYQVFSNLLDNAIKYTPEDQPVEVTVKTLPNAVRVSVIDRGPGIPQEQLMTLFAPFTRGRSEATSQASGLGLGLSVCRGIMELHGGRIGASSEMGRGSVFFFELPIVPEMPNGE